MSAGSERMPENPRADVPFITDIVGRQIKITDNPVTTAPLHVWDGHGDGHNCDRCPVESIWKCDEKAHIRRCECDAREDEATAYHGGNADGCPREANADEVVGGGLTFSSPALCTACIFGCAS